MSGSCGAGSASATISSPHLLEADDHDNEDIANQANAEEEVSNMPSEEHTLTDRSLCDLNILRLGRVKIDMPSQVTLSACQDRQLVPMVGVFHQAHSKSEMCWVKMCSWWTAVHTC